MENPPSAVNCVSYSVGVGRGRWSSGTEPRRNGEKPRIIPLLSPFLYIRQAVRYRWAYFSSIFLTEVAQPVWRPPRRAREAEEIARPGVTGAPSTGQDKSKSRGREQLRGTAFFQQRFSHSCLSVSTSEAVRPNETTAVAVCARKGRVSEGDGVFGERRLREEMDECDVILLRSAVGGCGCCALWCLE
ncbi:hypothetical protein G7046_g6726 [Stylonectria norvegica]|nr:hypothetical protein G7046_g6726 [Stylonectria norvegica]